MASRRVERVAIQIQQEIARLLLQKAKDPRLVHVTVTGTKVTPDLRIARIYYVSTHPDVGHEALGGALEKARGFLRGEIGRHLQLRYTPKLEFYYDKAVGHGRHMENLFQEMRARGELGELAEESDNDNT